MNDLPDKQYRLAIRRPVTMAMLFLTIMVFGWRSYQQLPLNLMPDISYPSLTIRSVYQGAAPEDVEKLVTRPLEEMLSIVSGVVEVSSISSADLSEIILEFTWDTDMGVAQQDVRDQLDLYTPPDGVTQKPVILRYDPTLDPVMRIAITLPQGNSAYADPSALTAVRESAERHLKSELEAETGIAQVLVKGGLEEEIQVLVNTTKLKNLGLSLANVVNSLNQRNINQAGGRLLEGKTEYLVRTLNEFTNVEEIAASILATPGGQQLYLSDVAEVFVGAKERESIVRINGAESVALDIFKEGDANTVEVCNRLKDLLNLDRKRGFLEILRTKISARILQYSQERERIKRGESPTNWQKNAPVEIRKKNYLDRLPKDVHLTTITDQSRFIVGAINEVRSALFVGGILALCILFLFLRDIKSTLIIGVAIPISVVAAFIPMFLRDISLNIMSLGGLALGVGMLVDNSIVVLESIFRCREEGDSTKDAAERGTQEVSSAVVASTLTTICVFLPIAFVEGIAGQMFGDLAMTVTFSLLASLLTALYLIPLIASRKPLALRADRQVVWALRAYREGRDDKQGHLPALLQILPRGTSYLVRYTIDTARDTFSPSLRALRGLPKINETGEPETSLPPRPLRILSAITAAIFLPLLAVLYLFQLLLAATSATTVTFGFLCAIIFMAFFLAVRAVLRVILWIPLRVFDAFFKAFRALYAITLEHSLRFSPVILLLTIALAVHAAYLSQNLGTELIPPLKQGEFKVRLDAGPGTRLEETSRRSARIEKEIRAVPEVESVTVEIGEDSSRGTVNRGENVAEFTVLLKDTRAAATDQDHIIEALRTRIKEVSPDVITFSLPTLFSFSTAVELQIIGDNLPELRRVGEDALAAVRQVPGVKDADLSVKAGYPEIIVDLSPDELAQRGISLQAVAQSLSTQVQGSIAGSYHRHGELIDIRVRTDKASLSTKNHLFQSPIGEGDAAVPLSAIANFRVAEGPSEIRRIKQRRVVIITANIDGRDLGSVSRDIETAVLAVPKPQDYFFVLGGQNRELQTSYNSLYLALALAIFLVYVVMASQFESIWHPAIVMFSVPLAFVGVVYALYYFKIDLSIMVFLGGIVLAGIVVNDAIVLVDYINQLRARNYAKRDAIIEAGMVRLRPILMTTVTTVLGLLPMILAAGEGAEMRRPMAITLMAGLSSATILTLLIIPMVYYIFAGRDKPTAATDMDTAEPAATP